MQNKDYANTWAISQTAIKDFRFKSPKRWKSIWLDKQEDGDKSDEGFTFGSLVDTLMFTPKALDERFFVGDFDLPSDAIEAICKSTYELILAENKRIEEENATEVFTDGEPLLEYNLEKCRAQVLYSAANYDDKKKKKKGWNNGWKEDTKIAKILEEGDAYFQILSKSNGRKIISQKTNFDAIEIKEVLEKDEAVRDYFIPSEGIELNFQMEIFVDYTLEDGRTIPLKGALDILRIDHNLKTIQIVDLKTTLSAYNFITSIKKYGYATQLSFYDHLLRIWLETECEGKFCNYTILNPLNIAIDQYDKVPYIYEYSWTDLELERVGNERYLADLNGTSTHNDKIKKGWQQLLEEIGWHFHNSYWEKPKELYENKKLRVNLLNS